MEFFVPPRQDALLSENTSVATSVRTRQAPSALDSPSSTDKLSHSVKTAASRRYSKLQVCAMDLVGQEKLAQAARTFTEWQSGLTRHS